MISYINMNMIINEMSNSFTGYKEMWKEKPVFYTGSNYINQRYSLVSPA